VTDDPPTDRASQVPPGETGTPGDARRDRAEGPPPVGDQREGVAHVGDPPVRKDDPPRPGAGDLRLCVVRLPGPTLGSWHLVSLAERRVVGSADEDVFLSVVVLRGPSPGRKHIRGVPRFEVTEADRADMARRVGAGNMSTALWHQVFDRLDPLFAARARPGTIDPSGR
jgi:hypothetical protein